MALTFLTNSWCTSFLTTFLSTTSCNIFELTGTSFNLTSNLSSLLLKLCKPLGIFSNSSISNLLIFDFKLAKSTFLAKSDVFMPVAFLS